MQTTDEFFRERGVDPSFARPAHHAAGSILRRLQGEYMCRTADAAAHITDPTWALALSALDRVTEYAIGAVCASVSSSVAGEIVSRTVVEACVNLLFILKGNRADRFYSYFHAYIEKERARNKKWETSIATLPANERAHHDAGLKQKDRALSHYRMVIDHAFGELGVNIAIPVPWGKNIYSRFDAVGQIVHYRTVYGALCSQTHNDAEDLLNKFAVYLLPDQTLQKRLTDETQSFSWFLTAVAVDDFSRAVECFLVAYDLIDPAEQIKQLCGEADRLVADAVAQLPKPPTTRG